MKTKQTWCDDCEYGNETVGEIRSVSFLQDSIYGLTTARTDTFRVCRGCAIENGWEDEWEDE